MQTGTITISSRRPVAVIGVENRIRPQVICPRGSRFLDCDKLAAVGKLAGILNEMDGRIYARRLAVARRIKSNGSHTVRGHIRCRKQEDGLSRADRHTGSEREPD